MIGTETTDICSLPPCGDEVKREPTTGWDDDVSFWPARHALRDTPETLRTNFQPGPASSTAILFTFLFVPSAPHGHDRWLSHSTVLHRLHEPVR